MQNSELISISVSAFLAVFFLLSVLAFIIRMIVRLFPEKGRTDSAVYAAIATSMASLFPGMKIRKIEEIK